MPDSPLAPVLVPVDGSEVSLRALAFALEEARQRGGSLHVLTVHAEPRVYGEIALYMGHERTQQLAEKRDRQVLAGAEAMLQASGVAFRQEALEGDPATVIARRAGELGCRQIVMGTRGLGLTAGLLLGSVATKVVHLAALPVTLIK